MTKGQDLESLNRKSYNRVILEAGVITVDLDRERSGYRGVFEPGQTSSNTQFQSSRLYG